MKFIVATWTCIIAVLMWTPLPLGDPSPLGHLDLAIHFGVFFILAQLVKGWISLHKNRFYWIDWGVIVLGLALLFETGQWFVPGRSVSWLDYAVNVLGVTVGGCASTELEEWPEIISDLASGGLSLLIGFGGIFYGEVLFHSLIELTNPFPLLPVKLIGGVLLGWIILNLTQYRWHQDRWFLQWLLLPGGLMVVYSPPMWNIVIGGVSLLALILVTFLYKNPLFRPIIRMVITVHVFCLLGGVVTTQQFLDGFGGIWVTVNLVLLPLLTIQGHLKQKFIPE